MKYLIPLLLLAACASPESVEPVLQDDYTFEIWQCQNEDDLQLCYSVWVPSPGYTLILRGKNFSYEINSMDQGCTRSSATVFAGDLWVTLKSGPFEQTRHLMIEW